MINGWVDAYKTGGDRSARDSLLTQFHPFLIQQSKKFSDIYKGVHPWDHTVHEAQIIFCDLLDEYTIGGTAYFNVYMMRKLPFRLRYFFVREIRRRTKYLSHSDEQFLTMDGGMIPAADDHAESSAIGLDNASSYAEVLRVLHDNKTLTSRELDMLSRYFYSNESHEVIATAYGISRCRVSRIIKNTLHKVRRELGIDVQ